MGRSLAAGVAGLVVGMVVTMAVQALGLQMYPLPPGVDPTDTEALAAVARQMPVGALLMVELSYLLGSLVVGIVIARIDRVRPIAVAAGAGLVLTVAGFVNLGALPHPFWFAVVSTLTYVPCVIAGAYFFRSRG